MKAIETRYKGYRFRSRLEARWAVFFDALGIEWVYEPEGYEKKDCNGNTIRYLPDFYLPKAKRWVEVKGNMTANEARKLCSFLMGECPLPGFSEGDTALILLGEIPDPTDINPPMHPEISYYHGLYKDWCVFFESDKRNGVGKLPYSARLQKDVKRTLLNASCFMVDGVFSDEDALLIFDTNIAKLPGRAARIITANAYATARSARFEHGQTPS